MPIEADYPGHSVRDICEALRSGMNRFSGISGPFGLGFNQRSSFLRENPTQTSPMSASRGLAGRSIGCQAYLNLSVKMHALFEEIVPL